MKLADNFTTDTQFDNLDNGESSAMSAYTKEQKALVKAYKQSHTLANDTYYIFVVNALSNGDTGYMVRGGQVGFVGLTPALSEGEGAISRTIAHELGHGAFMLQHTWDEPSLTKGTTNNLMDYAGGTALWHSQWAYMRNPDLIFRPFEGDDEGAYLGSNYFVAINGYPIQIKDADIGSLTVGLRTRYASGTLYGFKNKKNEKYLPYYKDNNFVGYQNQTILTDIIPVTKITEKTLKVQFIEATNSLCEYKVSTGMYKVPMIIYINELLSIDMPLKRDSSTIFKRTDCDEDGNIIINDDYTLFDYSAENGTKGLSKEDKEFLDVIAKNAKSFTGENVHIYILHKDDPKYAEKKARADEDKEPKLVFTINKDGKLNLEYKINVPKWLVNLLPDAGKTDACMLDYVNKELDKLHTRTEYIISPWPKKMAMETAIVFYNSFTSSIYCATSEELVRNENAYVKFGAGAIHELIATVDVDQLIQGITELVTKSVSGKIDGYAKYFTEIKQTFEDAKANKVVPYDVIFSRLVPPGISDTGNQIKMVYDLGVQAKNLLFTSCQNKTELGTNMCPYRWGRATVMILPIIFTGGEWAILKFKSIGLAAEFGSEALRGMEMIAAAQKGGRTVIDDVGKTIVKDADGSVSTIKNVSEGKVVLTEGVESIEDAVKVLEKEIADPDLLKAAKEQVIEEVAEDVNKLKDKDWLKNILKGNKYEKDIFAEYAKEGKLLRSLEKEMGLAEGYLSKQNGFEHLQQLQIKIGDSYFIADDVWVRSFDDANGVKKFECYISESKLNKGTNLSKYQNQFSNALKTTKDFEIRSLNKGKMSQGSLIEVRGAKRINGPEVNNSTFTEFKNLK